MSLPDTIKIRPLTPSDHEQLNKLHASREEVARPEDAEKRTSLLEWIAFENPFANGEPTYFVAEHNGRIVALQGRMPVQFIIKGKRRKGYYVHDTYVHPEYRKRGWGFWIVSSINKAVEDRSDSFFCLVGGTPLNLKIQRRMGYREIALAPQYAKILDPMELVSQTINGGVVAKLLGPSFRGLLLLVDAVVCVGRTSGRLVRRISRFDSRVDELSLSLADKLGASTFRTSSFLNWRYVDRPFPRETILAAEENGVLKGYVVVGPSRGGKARAGMIVDILADPQDGRTISALCQAATKHFRKERMALIRVVLSDDRYARILRRFLFFKTTSGKPLLIGNLERCGDEGDYLLDVKNWHMTLGESDGFMLNPA